MARATIQRAHVFDRLVRTVLVSTLRHLAEGRLDVVSPSGPTTFGDRGSPRHAQLVVHDERVFRRVLAGGDIGFGESYMDGDWTSPDLVGLLRLAIRNVALFEDRNGIFSAVSRWRDLALHRLRPNSRRGSRTNISFHYDIGNDFYRLFLDRSMAYSSGIYRSASDSLEQAQVEKFDRICRKLRLGPSDHVLEIGTGWGGFAAWAAARYGCRVTTTTISAEQHAYAAALFARLHLADRVTLLLEDYRDLAGRFEKIVSIEMFEAVGYRNYDAFFRQCDRLLAPDGTMLLQAITITDQRFCRYLASPDWIRKYILPGGELASVAAVLQSLGRTTSLGLYHAEDIGAHYARTLRAWRERFVAALDRVREFGFDDRFIRTWEYYLASCEAAFLERQVGDVQLLLTKTMNVRSLMDEPWEDEWSPRGAAGPRNVRPEAPSVAAFERPAPGQTPATA
jgi:cyclopropane-fatty-acyl-phospholipid synthase